MVDFRIESSIIGRTYAATEEWSMDAKSSLEASRGETKEGGSAAFIVSQNLEGSTSFQALGTLWQSRLITATTTDPQLFSFDRELVRYLCLKFFHKLPGT